MQQAVSKAKGIPLDLDCGRVHAILVGRLTQLRMPIEPQPPKNTNVYISAADGSGDFKFFSRMGDTSVAMARTGWIPCPFTIGTRIRIRERWRMWEDPETLNDYAIYETGNDKTRMPSSKRIADLVVGKFDEWQPSRLMPKWATRIILEVIDLRVEKLQQITDDDIWNMGIRLSSSIGGVAYREKFQWEWNDQYAELGLGWDADPWVLVPTVRRVT